MPLNIEPVNGSTPVTTSYYRIGDSYTRTAHAMSGYSMISPASLHVMTLVAATNTLDFVYSNVSPAVTGNLPPAAAGAVDKALTSTGTNLWVLALGGIAAIAGGTYLTRRLMRR